MNRLIISIFLLSGVLLACGQKGDLYIPQDPSTAQIQQGQQQDPAALKNTQQEELKKEQQPQGE